MSEVLDLLSTIEDPRVADRIIYPLPTLLFISICAIFCGAESWDDIVVLLNHAGTGLQNMWT
jgi:hypothetical protein